MLHKFSITSKNVCRWIIRFFNILDILRKLGVEKECIKENNIDEDEEIPEM